MELCGGGSGEIQGTFAGTRGLGGGGAEAAGSSVPKDTAAGGQYDPVITSVLSPSIGEVDLFLEKYTKGPKEIS